MGRMMLCMGLHPGYRISCPGSCLMDPVLLQDVDCCYCFLLKDRTVLLIDEQGPGKHEPDTDRPPLFFLLTHRSTLSETESAVFSHNDVFSFEDVLGMASVFSEQACPSLKTEYTFRIYGGCHGGLSASGGKGTHHRINTSLVYVDIYGYYQVS